MASAAFLKILGVDRIVRLSTAFQSEIRKEVRSNSSFVVFSIILVLCYALLILTSTTETLSNFAFLGTLLISGCGFLLWLRLEKERKLFGGFSLIHTSFALGVVPALVLIFFFRGSFTQALNVGTGGKESTLAEALVGITIAGLFAGVTEEVIFRGLLLSSLRRLWSRYKYRDLLALVVSSVLFGAFHSVLWGPVVGLALVGVGLGLGAGYIASGERLGTVILYHAVFDLLSLMLGFFLFIL